MIQAVLRNVGPVNLAFPFRLVTQAASNVFHMQETPPTHAFRDRSFFPFLFENHYFWGWDFVLNWIYRSLNVPSEPQC